MKIPNKIKIGGFYYKVEKRKSNDKEKNSNNWGITYHSDKLILIDKDINEQQQIQTFFHEILHCIDVIYNSRQLTEESIERLSQGIYQVLKDNRLLK